MNRSVLWSRIGVSAAVAVVMAAGSGSAVAQEDDGLALKMAEASKPGRFFMRGGAIFVKIKTKSGDTYDVTGPVISYEDLVAVTALENRPIVTGAVERPPGVTTGNFANLATGAQGAVRVRDRMFAEGISGLGTPPGVKGEASKQEGTIGLSIGYFLDESQNWALESYVLAVPLSTSVTARGQSSIREGEDDQGNPIQVERPFGLEGQKIIKTKLLPPVVMLGRYWGDATSKFRPYVGAIAMYAMFYDTKATQALNSYVGGGSPGDTTVSIKNSFGMGPMVGLKYEFAERWHLSFNVGHVRLKTQATLTTRNTTLTNQTGAIQDYGCRENCTLGNGSISDEIATGEFTYRNNAGIRLNGGVVGVVSKGVAAIKGQENLGTFVRKTDTKLDNTLFMLSVGRTF
jgi:outer membrane protein W